MDNFLSNREEFVELALQLKWAVQLLSGLRYIHSQKIIHRNIKPALVTHLFKITFNLTNLFIFSRNIFLISNIIKYGDFGLARQLSDTLSEAETKFGSSCYFAPEILGYNANASNTYTMKIDIW